MDDGPSSCRRGLGRTKAESIRRLLLLGRPSLGMTSDVDGRGTVATWTAVSRTTEESRPWRDHVQRQAVLAGMSRSMTVLPVSRWWRHGIRGEGPGRGRVLTLIRDGAHAHLRTRWSTVVRPLLGMNRSRVGWRRIAPVSERYRRRSERGSRVDSTVFGRGFLARLLCLGSSTEKNEDEK